MHKLHTCASFLKTNKKQNNCTLMQNTSCKLTVNSASWFHKKRIDQVQNNPAWETFSKTEYRSSNNKVWLVHEGVWSAGNTIKTFPDTWNIETDNKRHKDRCKYNKEKISESNTVHINTVKTDTGINHRYMINSNMGAGRPYLPLLSWTFYSLLLLVCLGFLDFLYHDEARITGDNS